LVFNATFNNISVLLVEETGVPRENHRPGSSHWQTLKFLIHCFKTVETLMKNWKQIEDKTNITKILLEVVSCCFNTNKTTC
jgi:hypothetical protein